MSHKIAFLTLASILLVSDVAMSQESRSTIAGSVRDPQQAAVPGVQILAVQTDMGTEFKTVSNESGQFVLPLLPPGNYRITVETAGFKRYVRENFAISANQRYQLDIELELGGVTETVTVEAAAPMLTANTASMGQAIVTSQIENMPMNGRTPLALAQLAFGVVPTVDRQFFRPFDNNGPSGFSMGGAPQRSNELLLDGAPNMMRNRVIAYNPPVDVVGEVKVETFQADAAYGNTGGGTVNVVLKGGTNQLHGTLYEFNQVSLLAATPFFTNRAGQPKSVTRYNQYGGSAGGPVWIPRCWTAATACSGSSPTKASGRTRPNRSPAPSRPRESARATSARCSRPAPTTRSTTPPPAWSKARASAASRSPTTSFPPTASTRSPRTSCNSSPSPTSRRAPTARTTTPPTPSVRTSSITPWAAWT